MKQQTNRKYLQAIIDHGNFTNAAKALYISQPYLSRYLKELEEEMGTELIDRDERPIILTYAGERYMRYMTQIDLLYEELDHEFDSIINKKKGRLRFGINPMIGAIILHRILPAFFRSYPNVDVEIIEKTAEEEENLLIQNKIDFSININPILNDDISSMLLYSETLCLIVPNNNQHYIDDQVYAYRPLFDFKELNGQQFILMKDSSAIRRSSEQLFKKHKVVPQVVMETSNVLTALNLASSGMGLAIVPESIIPDSPNLNYNVYKIRDPAIKSEVIFKYLSNTQLAPLVLDFFDIAQETMVD